MKDLGLVGRRKEWEGGGGETRRGRCKKSTINAGSWRQRLCPALILAMTYVFASCQLCDGGCLGDGLIDALHHDPVAGWNSVNLDGIACLRDP